MSYLARSLKKLQRGLTTNHAMLDADSDDPRLRPITLSGSPPDVAEMIEKWTAQQPHWSLESREQIESTITLHLTRRTRLARFVDDIHVRLSPEPESTRVDAESQSRIGKGDLGQNARNLRELTDGLLDSQ